MVDGAHETSDGKLHTLELVMRLADDANQEQEEPSDDDE
jgi:hypothetical protein